MGIHQSIELREKLGLTSFGIPQPGLPMLEVPKLPKPTDLPENTAKWLSKYEKQEKSEQ